MAMGTRLKCVLLVIIDRRMGILIRFHITDLIRIINTGMIMLILTGRWLVN